MRKVALFWVGLVLGGCALAEPPFVVQPNTVTVSKEKDNLHRFGIVQVCYGQSDFEDAKALAAETCKEYGLESIAIRTERYQCKITAPHRTTFRCYDPKMRYPNGKWVNVMNQNAVTQWRQQQAALTGLPVSEIYAGPIQAAPQFQPIIRQDVDEPRQIGGQ